jgi:hypothetical protein
MSERCKLFYFNCRSISVLRSEIQYSKYWKQDACTITAKIQTITCETGTTLSPPPHYYTIIRPQKLWRLQMTGFLDLAPFSLLPIYQPKRGHSPEDPENTNLHCPHRYNVKSHTQNVPRINRVLRTRKLAFQCQFHHLKSFQFMFMEEGVGSLNQFRDKSCPRMTCWSSMPVMWWCHQGTPNKIYLDTDT